MEMLMVIAVSIFVKGVVNFIAAAFKTHILWGLGCIFITPVSIVYLIIHWDEAKKPLFIQLLGLAVFVFLVSVGVEVPFFKIQDETIYGLVKAGS